MYPPTLTRTTSEPKILPDTEACSHGVRRAQPNTSPASLIEIALPSLPPKVYDESTIICILPNRKSGACKECTSPLRIASRRCMSSAWWATSQPFALELGPSLRGHLASTSLILGPTLGSA